MLIDFEDRVVLGAISGALAIILRDIYSLLSNLIGFAKHLVWHIAADLFMKGDQTKTVIGNIVGFLSDIAMGAFLGVIFVYIIKYTKGQPEATFLGHLLGFLGDLAMGSLFGIGFVYFLKYTNMKNIIWKGWGFGLAVWLLIFGIMLHSMPQTSGTAPETMRYPISAPFSDTASLVSAWVYIRKYCLKSLICFRMGGMDQKTAAEAPRQVSVACLSMVGVNSNS
jgi:hypothetical protein